MSLSNISDNLKLHLTKAVLQESYKNYKTNKTVYLAEGGCLQRPHISILRQIKTCLAMPTTYNFNIYDNEQALPDFIEEIKHYFEKRLKLTHDSHNLASIFAYGVSHLLDTLIQSQCKAGDYIVAPSSFYHQFAEFGSKNGVIFKTIPTKVSNSFKLTADDLKGFIFSYPEIVEKTKILILTSPTTTGCLYSKKEIDAIAEVLHHTNWLIFHDAVFCETLFEQEELNFFASHDKLTQRVITANSGSKSYGIADARIGWGYGPKHIIDHMIFILENSIIQIPRITQAIGLTSFKVPRCFLEREVKEWHNRSSLIIKRIGEINLKLKNKFNITTDFISCPITPKSGQYVYLNINGVQSLYTPENRQLANNLDLLEYLLFFKEGIALSSGYSKGHDDFSFYISYGQCGYQAYRDAVAPIEKMYLDNPNLNPESYLEATHDAFEKGSEAGRNEITEALNRLEEALLTLKA